MESEWFEETYDGWDNTPEGCAKVWMPKPRFRVPYIGSEVVMRAIDEGLSPFVARDIVGAPIPGAQAGRRRWVLQIEDFERLASGPVKRWFNKYSRLSSELAVRAPTDAEMEKWLDLYINQWKESVHERKFFLDEWKCCTPRVWSNGDGIDVGITLMSYSDDTDFIYNMMRNPEIDNSGHLMFFAEILRSKKEKFDFNVTDMEYKKQYGCQPFDTQFYLQCTDDFAKRHGYHDADP